MKTLKELTVIVFGSILYALGTVIFIFPGSLLLGGTSGISVILNAFIPFSSGTILVVINTILTIAAFLLLGKNTASKTLAGSILTTLFIGVFEQLFSPVTPLISNNLLSAVLGAVLISFASAVMFYVDSSSGGTDIIALIIKKYSGLNIGKALLVSDVLIVIAGGIISGTTIAICSLVGLLIKTSGIDFIIKTIKNRR